MLLALALTIAAQQAPRDAPAPNAAAPAGSGVIKGRVVAAETGTPVRRVLVTIGAPGLPPRTIYTDAAGRYEARNLPPGSYFVNAAPPPYLAQFLPPAPPPLMPDGSLRRVPLAAGQTLEWYDLILPRAGAIVGRVVDEHGDPVSGVTVWAQRSGETARSSGQSQSSDEFGRYRVFRLEPGEYDLVAKAGSIRIETAMNAPSIGFIDTFYPGTLSRRESTRIRVRAAQETQAADLQLVTARLIRVRGVVASAPGAPSGPPPMVTLSHDNGSQGTSVDPQGRFSFMPQPPGAYRLTARRLSENREATLEFGSTPLTLTDTDVDDVVLTMKPTVAISGRVAFDGGVPPEVAAHALTIRAQPPRRDPYADSQPSPGPVGPDLTFTVRHLAGELLLRPSGGLPGGWSLKAVLLGAEDITDAPREFRADDSGRIQIVLTNRWSELSGVVTGDKGERTLSGTVVLFGEDRATWFAESSRMHASRITKDGRFVLRGLRAGRYHVVALPPGVRWDFQQIDKAALETYAADAIAVTLGEDERRQVDLRLASPAGGDR